MDVPPETHMKLKLAVFLSLAAATARADILDLSGATLTGVRNGATFSVFDFQSSGTGVLNPFLRIDNDNRNTTCGASNLTRECGYNTAGSVDPATDTKSGTWTHALLMSAYSGTFILDINEPNGGGQEFLSIDQLQIYGANVDDVLVGSTSYGGTLNNPNLTLLWDLDGSTDNTDYSVFVRDRFSGSGTTDLKIAIPKSLFYDAAANYDYLVLFANMGNVDDPPNEGDADGGFEEFATVSGNAVVPEPGAILLFAPVGAFVVGILRKRLRT